MRREERDEAFERLLDDDAQAQPGALAEFVDGTREAFVGLPSEERSQQHLTAIVEAARSEAASAPLSAPAKRRSKRMISVILGTVAGKVAAAALGLGVATAAMASTNTLPAPAQDAVANAAQTVGVNLPGGNDEVAAEDEGSEPEQAKQGKQTAEAKKEAANAFTTAKKAWTACVSEAAPQHEGDEDFDPEAACGDKPRPQDFGLTETPEQAERGQQRAEDARNSAPNDDAPEGDDEAGENRPESDDASDQRDDRADGAEELGANHSGSGNAPEGVANGGGSNGSRGAR